MFSIKYFHNTYPRICGFINCPISVISFKHNPIKKGPLKHFHIMGITEVFVFFGFLSEAILRDPDPALKETLTLSWFFLER